MPIELRHLLVLLPWFVLNGFAGLLQAASEPGPALIEQLGDADFERRVAAERELLRMGAAGLSVIEAGLQSKDPEIRLRSSRILNLLRKIAFDEQREKVRQNPWTAPQELAPAWDVFHALAGDSFEARNFYVQMIEEERDLMLAVALRPQAWGPIFDRRCAELRSIMDRQPNQEISPLSVLTLLLLAGHPDSKLNPIASQTISSLLVDANFFRYLHSLPEKEKRVCRTLLSDWVTRGGRASPASRLDLASKYQLPAGISAAAEIIGNRHAVGASRVQLQNAVRFVCAYGDLNSVGVLEPLLESVPLTLQQALAKPIPTPNPSRPATTTPILDHHLSDMALLGLLQYTRQDPAAYGFANFHMDRDRRYTSNPPSFTSDRDRRRALLQWQSWRAAHRLHFSPPPVDASEGFET